MSTPVLDPLQNTSWYNNMSVDNKTKYLQYWIIRCSTVTRRNFWWILDNNMLVSVWFDISKINTRRLGRELLLPWQLSDFRWLPLHFLLTFLRLWLVNLNRTQQKAVEITRQEPIKKLMWQWNSAHTAVKFPTWKEKVFFWTLVKSKNVLQACHDKVERIQSGWKISGLFYKWRICPQVILNATFLLHPSWLSCNDKRDKGNCEHTSLHLSRLRQTPEEVPLSANLRQVPEAFSGTHQPIRIGTNTTKS